MKSFHEFQIESKGKHQSRNEDIIVLESKGHLKDFLSKSIDNS
jgi:hypothetical protein